MVPAYAGDMLTEENLTPLLLLWVNHLYQREGWSGW